MEQITRDEMIGILSVAACPAYCNNGVIVRDQLHGEIEQCQFCYEREHAITALKAAEPVGIVVDNCGKNFVNWRGETPWLDSAKPGTELFTLPCHPAKALYPVGEVIGEMSTDPEFVKGLEDGRQWLREAKAQVPEGVNAELIVEILSDYASLQQDGVIDSAGRYSPADAMEQADLLLTASPAKASHWSTNNPGRADQYMGEALAARRALGFSEDAEDVAPIDITNAIVELRQPATELAPESWREELETIAEILEADGDEWNCAARIRKMLTASPAPEQNPAKDFCDAHCTFLGHHPACAIGRQQEEPER